MSAVIWCSAGAMAPAAVLVAMRLLAALELSPDGSNAVGAILIYLFTDLHVLSMPSEGGIPACCMKLACLQFVCLLSAEGEQL